jgi:hypothetical protein
MREEEWWPLCFNYNLVWISMKKLIFVSCLCSSFFPLFFFWIWEILGYCASSSTFLPFTVRLDPSSCGTSSRRSAWLGSCHRFLDSCCFSLPIFIRRSASDSCCPSAVDPAAHAQKPFAVRFRDFPSRSGVARAHRSASPARPGICDARPGIFAV